MLKTHQKGIYTQIHANDAFVTKLHGFAFRQNAEFLFELGMLYRRSEGSELIAMSFFAKAKGEHAQSKKLVDEHLKWVSQEVHEHMSPLLTALIEYISAAECRKGTLIQFLFLDILTHLKEGDS